jgi:hypothetical protein
MTHIALEIAIIYDVTDEHAKALSHHSGAY